MSSPCLTPFSFFFACWFFLWTSVLVPEQGHVNSWVSLLFLMMEILCFLGLMPSGHGYWSGSPYAPFWLFFLGSTKKQCHVDFVLDKCCYQAGRSLAGWSFSSTFFFPRKEVHWRYSRLQLCQRKIFYTIRAPVSLFTSWILFVTRCNTLCSCGKFEPEIWGRALMPPWSSGFAQWFQIDLGLSVFYRWPFQ